jgi:hypothetical protein
MLLNPCFQALGSIGLVSGAKSSGNSFTSVSKSKPVAAVNSKMVIQSLRTVWVD